MSNRRVTERRRDVASETSKEVTGKKSGAMSSARALFYHDIPPEFYRRTALRHTGGHTKYSGEITMNLNWRQGLDDPLYVMDRLNHMFGHMVDLLDNGNDKDDNLGAIAWCCCFLMEAERMHPEVFKMCVGQSKLSGEAARKMKEKLQHAAK